MKRAHLWPILLLLLAACSEAPQPDEAPQYEASMNFDLSSVRPFLLELDSDLKLDLEVEEIVSFVRSVPMESVEFVAEAVIVEQDGRYLVDHAMIF